MKDIIRRRVSHGIDLETGNVERQLLTHIPDLVIFDKNPGKIPHVNKFDGVLLFADVSGFTALTERYTRSQEKGTDALTITLNAYIGKIVQNILQLGGDILKFAGDAILAVWKVTEREYLAYAISQATKCSLIIQEKCDNQMTDVGVKLRVKIAISAGKIYATFVGNDKSRYFVLAGRPVGEVNTAEKYCTAGRVVLSPNALELAERDNIIFDKLSERFSLARYIRHDPRKSLHEYIELPDANSRVVADKSIIRIALRLVPDKNRELFSRKYVTDVVQKKVDDNQPLKFLSEMRQCSIAFINMAFDLNERDREFHEKQCQNMQMAFNTVYNCCTDMQGSLNKIFMFDKGCTFLVIFGLPGDKHEEEPAHALQASWRISQELRRIGCLMYVSIGVTTGPVFCGVVGHEERHEYTVIGKKVNLAARLMMHYPDIVSCEKDTMEDSKLSMDLFHEAPCKDMKGCAITQVFQYKEGSQKPVGVTVIMEPEYPILGRQDEIKLFLRELRLLKNNETLGSQRRVIAFEGEAGYGKSRMMKEIQWRASQEDVRVVGFQLALNHATTPYFTLKTLLELLLGIQGQEDQVVRAKAITSATSPEDENLLWVLNDVMKVEFQLTEEVSRMTVEKRTKEMHRLVVNIVNKVAGSKFTIFALDDAQNIDDNSWRFITTLSKDYRALCVLAMRPFKLDKPPSVDAKQVLGHPKTMYVKLSALPNELMGALICQILHVHRIPVELEQTIEERSHGVPRWCEQLLTAMQKSGVIFVTPVTRSKTMTQAKTQYSVVDELLVTRSVDRKQVLLPDIPFHEQLEKWSKNKKQQSIEKIKIGSSVEEKKKSKTMEKEHEDDEISVESHPRNSRHGHKPSLPSWADRLAWRKSSTTLLDFLTNPEKTKSKEKMVILLEEEEEGRKIAVKECVIKPGFNIHKFSVPASIRGMALARLDRMKQYDQLIVKCAAVIGNNFSRRMLRSVLPGYRKEKFKRSMFRLMRLRILQCASSEESKNSKLTQNMEGHLSHGVICACHPEEENEGLTEEDIAERCEQLAFMNSLVQETAYDLWLESQRKSLHEACAVYLESKLNEVFLTGITDDAIAKQFRLFRKFSIGKIVSAVSLTSSSVLKKTSSQKIRKFRSPLKSKYVMDRTSSLQSVIYEKAKAKKLSKLILKDENLTVPDRTTGEAKHRRVSSSVIGRMTVERVGAYKMTSKTLDIKEEYLTGDYVSENDASETPQSPSKCEEKNTSTAIGSGTALEQAVNGKLNVGQTCGGRRGNAAASVAETSDRRMSYNPLWSQSVGLTDSYEKLLQSTENEAKRLTGYQLNKVLRTPYELHDVFAILYPQLAYHWKKAANTAKTIDYLLKAGESCIATMLLTEAHRYLAEANEIISNLAKGNDIIAKVNEEDDDGGIDDIKVLSVDDRIKAQVQSLLGRVYFQTGILEQALKHFTKALSIMKCGLPKNFVSRPLRSWHENRIQGLHMKYPQKYMGSAGSDLANKYVEQVRCLSYVWQILQNLPHVPHRQKLAKIVAVMQVNRAEAADDDLQELITSYTYMMQMHQFSGEVQKAAFYENKATMRCLELPAKLTAADLYITGHLHLVSCSIRFSVGKLAHATTSVLPILSQIHLLTGRGDECTELLSLLLSISAPEDDYEGLSNYYCCCMDLLLDGGYHHETGSDCIDYMQNIESQDIGDGVSKLSGLHSEFDDEILTLGEVQRLSMFANMALWCTRKQDKENASAWLSLAEKSLPEIFNNSHSVRAYTRIVESTLILFKQSIQAHGSKHVETLQAELQCRKDLQAISKLCKRFPVFYPRYLHLKAYYFMLTGHTNKAREKITQASLMAQYCGNKIDQQYALHSQHLWFSPSSLSNEDIDYWEKNCDNLPNWETANKKDYLNRFYSLKIPTFMARTLSSK